MSRESVVVVATIIPAPEHRSEVLAALEDTIATVQADDEGCELYTLQEADDRFVMIEKWASPELLQIHNEGPALKALMGRLAGKLGGRLEVHVLRPRAVGSAEQGTL